MTALTDDQKRQLIEGYLAQFAVDSFGHELNREVAIVKGDTEAVARADAAIAEIATATATYQAQLDALP